MTDAEFYQLRKRAGVCTKCGREDAFTMNGRALCGECCEKQNARIKRKKQDDEYRRKVNEYMLSWQKARIKAGICPQCGKPIENGKKQCEKCLKKKINKYHETYVHKQRNPTLCYECQKVPPVDGKRVCADCLQMLQQSAENARKCIDRDNHPWKRIQRIEIERLKKNKSEENQNERPDRI